MCLILFSINAHPDLPLVVAANRDEFYRRPTHSAHFWPQTPHILAGKDLEAGGTWMGITKDGRFAAVTNFRAPGKDAPHNPKSRGELVRDFLAQQAPNKTSARNYAEKIINQGHCYAGFNLILSDGNDFIYCNNQTHEITTLQDGAYALSNHLLNTPWPKATTGKSRLIKIVNDTQSNAAETDHEELANSLFTLLHDKQPASEDTLPKTGIDKNMERLLSSIFIESENYGTCCSTAIIFHKKNTVCFHEKQFYSKDHKKEHVAFFNQRSANGINLSETNSFDNPATESFTNENIFRFSLEK